MTDNNRKNKTEISTPPVNTHVADGTRASDNRHRALVEIVICGICTVIFLVLYMNEPPPRPPGGYNAAASYGLRSAEVAQEAYFVDHETYTDSIEILLDPLYGVELYEGVTVRIISADKEHYLMEAFHEQGDGRFTLKGPGGVIERVTE